jgi:DnaJ-class molecular chaperone
MMEKEELKVPEKTIPDESLQAWNHKQEEIERSWRCPGCKGRGFIFVLGKDVPGHTRTRCPDCNGSGKAD